MKITGFSSPWKKCEAPETVCYLWADEANLYFVFEVADENIVTLPGGVEENVASGDRVELFVSSDRKLSEYYCIEIDPNGNVLDYKASFYRSFDNGWDAPGLRIETEISREGYRVEGSLPLAGLNISRDGFYMGLYRADSISYQQNEDDIVWLTWVDPLQEHPDFHVPSSFRRVCIE